ncbi:hypothetical protein GQX74_015605 [Glossina fuscipes]|nr:hypothetical protein GQX74_015605 [Glossina fuscipes]
MYAFGRCFQISSLDLGSAYKEAIKQRKLVNINVVFAKHQAVLSVCVRLNPLLFHKYFDNINIITKPINKTELNYKVKSSFMRLVWKNLFSSLAVVVPSHFMAAYYA